MFFEWLADSSSVCGNCVLFAALVPHVNKLQHISIRKANSLLFKRQGYVGNQSTVTVPQVEVTDVLTLSCVVWTQVLGKYKRVEKGTDMLLSTLSAMQEKAQHLECNLSAETRIKLDLFSALGDTRRQLEIAQGSLPKLFLKTTKKKKNLYLGKLEGTAL